MACFAIANILVMALLLTDIVAEFQEMSLAYSSRNTFWTNMANQLNMTLPELTGSKLSPSDALGIKNRHRKEKSDFRSKHVGGIVGQMLQSG